MELLDDISISSPFEIIEKLAIKEDTLIKDIQISKHVVHVGESFSVEVFINNTKEYFNKKVNVTINGVVGRKQHLQFIDKMGIKKINVCASSSDNKNEIININIQVIDPEKDQFFPILSNSVNFYQEFTAELEITNASDIKIENPVFVWEMGDGNILETLSPSISYYYGDSLDNDNEYQPFHIKVGIRQDDKIKYSAQRTLTFWNYYVFNKNRGYIQPRVDTSDIIIDKKSLDIFKIYGNYTITNFEKEAIIFSSQKKQYHYYDTEHVSIPSKEEDCHIVVESEGMSIQKLELSLLSIPRKVFAYSIHLKGKTQSGVKAYAHAYFELRTNPMTTQIVTDISTLDLLNNIRSKKLVPNPNVINQQEIYNLQRSGKLKSFFYKSIPYYYDAVKTNHLRQLTDERIAPELVTGEIKRQHKRDSNFMDDQTIYTTKNLPDSNNSEVNILSEITSHTLGDKHDSSPFPLVGEICDPFNLPDDIPEGMSCQFTGEKDWTYVPGYLINARKGDIILSPGGDGIIAQLLKQVNPPQKYSHCGIMIRNYDQLRNSTASQGRIEDHPNGSFLGEPSPTDGFDSNVLKYMWPGTISLTIDEAYNGKSILDPQFDGKSYFIKTFGLVGRASKDRDTFLIIEPLVVKPLPSEETEPIRKKLHQIAEMAKTINGHYRLYCYTDPTIGLTKRAPAEPKWAAGSLPTQCASFIWLAVKLMNLQVEGKERFTNYENLEEEDKARGASVNESTLDGLYLYSAEERRNTAEFLYNYIYELVIAETEKKLHGKPLGEGTVSFFTDMPDDVANQIVNTFESDWSELDSKNSDRWRNASWANSISPDDFLYWDTVGSDRPNKMDFGGLYGYSEKLIYKQARYENVPISKWVKSVIKSTLIITVRYRGKKVPAALVSIGGLEKYTDSQGKISFEIPSGSYVIKAEKLIDGWSASITETLELKPSAVIERDLILQEPDELFREIRVKGKIDSIDYEDVGSDEYSTKEFDQIVLVGPYSTHADISIEDKFGGEVRIELRFRIDLKFPDLNVLGGYNLKFYEGDSVDTDDLDGEIGAEFSVGKDTAIKWTGAYIHSWNAGRTQLEFIVENNRSIA